MLNIIIDYGVPVSLFALMLIVGSGVRTSDFARVVRYPRAVALGAVGPLALLPPLAFVIVTIAKPPATLTTALLLLAVCPGGGISNYYCYLARCNISLSATITVIGTVCSIVTIPLWLGLLSGGSSTSQVLPEVPVVRIILQLLAFMALPMIIGMILLRTFPQWIERQSNAARWLSFGIVIVILAMTTWVVRKDLATLAVDIVLLATLFIVGGTLLGQILAWGMKPDEGPALIIEGAVRNVGVALVVGRSLLDEHSIGIFASFLSGYFMIAMLIMLPYSQTVAARISRAQSAARYHTE